MRKLIAAALAAAMIVPMTTAPAEARGKDRWEKHDRYDRHDRHDRRYRDRHASRDRYDRRYDRRDRHRYRDRDRYVRYDRRDYRRSWRRGDRFDRRYVRTYRPVYYRDYRSRLYAPPRGYRWVRADNDALLIGITSGIVSAIVSNAFYR
ncbi:RcnB family protein [Croceicoccus naphthovorans]|uniref:Uncharacterized protein n=1 Tax=Croceicoccus naphthovorans TaxID=1348774 RepID=A0A0G3XCE8_9SPHN|nr:RcnB family protein [Croceicoccus naphthovorans]AKM08872.1 hypothetical protein AB433_00955 [Croceicoccus naphthovorans]MBB3989371.1 Ni/Co efflux regulator RcnB [Croceicoccus naphthovorans]